MTCPQYPTGHLEYGYSVYSFTERLTSSGPEATVTYVGPSRYRFRFIYSIFGAWYLAKSPTTGECCVCLAISPCPYPSYTKLDTDLEGCYPDRDCLYPDTFSIAPFDSNSTPTVDDCPAVIWRPCERPYFYGDGKTGDGVTPQACDCPAAITVNYRAMNHAKFPRYFDPCEDQDVWELPPVSEGTYIEARVTSALSVNRIPSKSLKYLPGRVYSRNATPFEVGELPEYEGHESCAIIVDLSTFPEQAFCDPATTTTVDSELSPGRVRNTELLEIRWSNVPLPNWNRINALKGRVNSTVFLGYPPESVLFETAEPFLRPVWGSDGDYCGEVYDIVFRFTVLTAEVNVNETTLTEAEMLHYGIYKGRIGIWNRLWSNSAIAIGGTDCCTNWVPVVVKDEACCNEEVRLIYDYAPVWIGSEFYCFNELFTMKNCLQCVNDCPTNWPDCAFTPPGPPE